MTPAEQEATFIALWTHGLETTAVEAFELREDPAHDRPSLLPKRPIFLSPEAGAWPSTASRGSMPPRQRYRCRFCGAMLPAWLPVAKRPEGSMLLYHLSQHHPDRVAPYLQRMETECIATVAAEAFEVVEEDKT